MGYASSVRIFLKMQVEGGPSGPLSGTDTGARRQRHWQYASVLNKGADMSLKKRVIAVIILVIPIGEALADDRLPAPARAAVSAIQSMVQTFLGWALLGGLVGVLLALTIGKNRAWLRQPLFSLSVFAGLCVAVLDHLGKLPWS